MVISPWKKVNNLNHKWVLKKAPNINITLFMHLDSREKRGKYLVRGTEVTARGDRLFINKYFNLKGDAISFIMNYKNRKEFM